MSRRRPLNRWKTPGRRTLNLCVRILEDLGYKVMQARNGADAIVHHGVLFEGVSFIGKPYTPLALALKVREVIDKA